MNLEFALYWLLAVAAGSLGGIHVPINGALGARINSPLVATFTFYGVGFAIITALCLIRWDRAAFQALATVPKWYFVAGVISVLSVGSSTFLIPRVGAVNLFVVVVASQMTVRMFISHYGWLESPVSAVNWVKLLGAALLVLGAVLVVRD